MENSQRVMNLSVLAGVTLLKSGAEIFRVQDTMQRRFSFPAIPEDQDVFSGNQFFQNIQHGSVPP